MLYVGLISCLVLFALSNLSVRLLKRPGRVVVPACLLFLLGLPVLNMTIPAVLVLTVALMAGAAWRGGALLTPARFGKFSAGALAASLGVGSIMVFQSMAEFARLRAIYPFESMEARLEGWTPRKPAAPLSDESKARLAESDRERGRGFIRAARLRRLHESAVDLFVQSPGFGVSRLDMTPYEGRLAVQDHGPIPQPVPPDRPGKRPGPEAPDAPRVNLGAGRAADLSGLVGTHVDDFTEAHAFGYQKDRRHVAGFVPHRFRKPVRDLDDWEVESIELVGLLRSPPRVYISPNLPRMDDLKSAPTRPLDPFERSGLDRLDEGRDLAIGRAGDELRMVGAIRASTSCLDCHGAAYGDLLGAFSYRLRARSVADGPGSPDAVDSSD